MNLHRVPALMGTGCLALMMGAFTAAAQQQPGNSMPSTGATPSTSSSPNSTMSGAGQMDAQSAGAMGGGHASAMDKKFVKEAMEGSTAEVELGKMAQEKASSDDVKQFAQRMVQDHTKMKEQMSPVASQLGVTASDSLSPKDQALQKRLEGLSGDQFDKAYMSAMVQDHKKDLAEFKKEASSAKDPQVKDQAQQGSQIISEHLQMAEQVAQKVGAGTGKTAKGHTAPEATKPVGGASGSAIGGGGNTAGHHNSVGSGEGSTTSNPK